MTATLSRRLVFVSTNALTKCYIIPSVSPYLIIYRQEIRQKNRLTVVPILNASMSFFASPGTWGNTNNIAFLLPVVTSGVVGLLAEVCWMSWEWESRVCVRLRRTAWLGPEDRGG